MLSKSHSVFLGTRSEPWAAGAGLGLLNISLDTLRPDRFNRMTRRRGHERVMAAILRAVELGYDPVKVRDGLLRWSVACLIRARRIQRSWMRA